MEAFSKEQTLYAEVSFYVTQFANSLQQRRDHLSST